MDRNTRIQSERQDSSELKKLYASMAEGKNKPSAQAVRRFRTLSWYQQVKDKNK